MTILVTDAASGWDHKYAVVTDDDLPLILQSVFTSQSRITQCWRTLLVNLLWTEWKADESLSIREDSTHAVPTQNTRRLHNTDVKVKYETTSASVIFLVCLVCVCACTRGLASAHMNACLWVEWSEVVYRTVRLSVFMFKNFVNRCGDSKCK